MNLFYSNLVITIDFVSVIRGCHKFMQVHLLATHAHLPLLSQQARDYKETFHFLQSNHITPIVTPCQALLVSNLVLFLIFDFSSGPLVTGYCPVCIDSHSAQRRPVRVRKQQLQETSVRIQQSPVKPIQHLVAQPDKFTGEPTQCRSFPL